MAKVAILHNTEVLGQALAAPLGIAGFQTYVAHRPIDFEKLADFGPEVIVLAADRGLNTTHRMKIDLETDAMGYSAMAELEKYPALQVVPLLLVGSAVRQSELKTSIKYDAFLAFPEEASAYVDTVRALSAKIKSRRHISGYMCPHCRGRLTFTQRPVLDLFCPRCHTPVAIIDDDACIYSVHGSGPTRNCKMKDITAGL
jgi:uncharacterized protein YlaI